MLHTSFFGLRAVRIKRSRTSADLDTIFMRVRMTSSVAPLSSPMVRTSSTSTSATVPTCASGPGLLSVAMLSTVYGV